MARRYTIDGRLGALTIRGSKVKANVADAVTKATLNLSASEVTQLDLTISDPDLDLLRARLFDSGTPHKAGSALTYSDLELEVRAVGVDSAGITVTARSAGAMRLKRAYGHLVRRHLSPTSFAALEARHAGLKFVGEPSPKRAHITRQQATKGGQAAESSWDTVQRLAQELGYLAFEAGGVLYFGQPTYLVRHTTNYRVAWKGTRSDPRIRALPSCRRTGDGDAAGSSVDLELLAGLGDSWRPGHAIDLSGVPTFDGRYMVNTVTIELDDATPVTVNASRPTNPAAQPGTS